MEELIWVILVEGRAKGAWWTIERKATDRTKGLICVLQWVLPIFPGGLDIFCVPGSSVLCFFSTVGSWVSACANSVVDDEKARIIWSRGLYNPWGAGLWGEWDFLFASLWNTLKKSISMRPMDGKRAGLDSEQIKGGGLHWTLTFL